MSSSGSGLSLRDVIFNKTYFYSIISSNGSCLYWPSRESRRRGRWIMMLWSPRFLRRLGRPLLINRCDLGLFHFLQSSSSSHLILCWSSSATAAVDPLIFTDSGRCITLILTRKWRRPSAVLPHLWVPLFPLLRSALKPSWVRRHSSPLDANLH